MSSDEVPAWVGGAASDILAALPDVPGAVVVIDGPSGSGKSTLADRVIALGAVRSLRLVRMDDLYPGWSGLDTASRAVGEDLLAPLRATGIGRWRRWDWTDSSPAEWHEVDEGPPLVVEGCGCLTRATAPLATLRVWVEADEGIRRSRALARDAGGFDAHWTMWQRQWERFVAREHPRELADLVIDTSAQSGQENA